jgi:DNA-binding HxlR family transcriptional regulator
MNGETKQAITRSYGDSCGIARALDLTGERWALLIVRELLLGPKRFTDLRAGLPAVSPDVLAQRLRQLEQVGVVRRRKLAPPAGARVYELTAWGAELEPVLLALGRWGSRAPLPRSPAELSPDALAVALMSMFDPSAAAGVDSSYHVRLGEYGFSVTVAGGSLEVDRAEAPAPGVAVAIEGDTATLAAVLWHGVPVGEAISSGRLRVVGDQRELAHFLGLFRQPAAAGSNT